MYACSKGSDKPAEICSGLSELSLPAHVIVPKSRVLARFSDIFFLKTERFLRVLELVSFSECHNIGFCLKMRRMDTINVLKFCTFLK